MSSSRSVRSLTQFFLQDRAARANGKVAVVKGGVDSHMVRAAPRLAVVPLAFLGVQSVVALVQARCN